MVIILKANGEYKNPIKGVNQMTECKEIEDFGICTNCLRRLSNDMGCDIMNLHRKSCSKNRITAPISACPNFTDIVSVPKYKVGVRIKLISENTSSTKYFATIDSLTKPECESLKNDIDCAVNDRTKIESIRIYEEL